MADIDLIPVDYREWLARQTLLRNYGAALGALIVMLVIAGAALGHYSNQAEARVLQLKAESAITQQQQMQLEALREQQTEYERRWSLLRGLRAGAAVDEIFTLIDRSIIAGDLWFLDWSFRRAGVIVDGQQRGVETGYFVIVAESDDPLAAPDLTVETHMTIRGQAIDHQALSKFVRALFEEPAISDVNVQRTSLTSYANGRVVEFDITVVLNSTYRES